MPEDCPMHEADIAVLKNDNADLKQRLGSVEKELAEQRGLLNRGRGAVWVLMALGAAVGIGLGWLEKLQKWLS